MLRIHEHDVKSVQIRSFFLSLFSVFGLNTEKYGLQKTPYLDIFCAVMEFFSEGFFYETKKWIIPTKSFYCWCRDIYEIILHRYDWLENSPSVFLEKMLSRSGFEKKLSWTGDYHRSSKRKCNKSCRSHWRAKNISVLYFPVMLKQLEKNATFEDIMCSNYLQNNMNKTVPSKINIISNKEDYLI